MIGGYLKGICVLIHGIMVTRGLPAAPGVGILRMVMIWDFDIIIK